MLNKKQIGELFRNLYNRGEKRNLTSFEKILTYCDNVKQAENIIDNFRPSLGREIWYNYFSEELEDFIGKLINKLKPKIYLDPWLASPYIPLFLKNTFPDIKGDCITVNQTSKELTEQFNIGSTIYLGDPLKVIQELKFDYDLILAFPPLNVKAKPDLELKDYGHQIILDSSKNLSENGRIIFIGVDRFIHDNSKNSLKSRLSFHGLRIDAVISLPKFSVSKNIAIKTNLIILSKGTQQQIVVAELSESNSGRNKLAEIIIDRKLNNQQISELSESLLAYRSLIKDVKKPVFTKSYDELLPYENLAKKSELNDLLDKTGFNIVELSSVCKNIKSTRIDKEQPSNNSIYMPKIGLGNTFISLNDESTKAKNIYKIDLNPEMIHPMYAVNYLNSYHGKKARSEYMSGATIQYINIKDVEKVRVVLPPIDIQKEILEQDEVISVALEKLDSLKNKLWNYLGGYKNFKNEAKSILKDESAHDWIEFLPFPLSSVLWGYYAESSADKKISYLLLFFEVLTEFTGIIFLSAITKDKEFYDTYVKKWMKGRLVKGWFEKATFGSWYKLLEFIAPNIRKYFSSKNEDETDNKEFVLNLFGGVTNDFIEFITSKKLISNLNKALYIRNSKAHGSIKSDKDLNEELQNLEVILSDLKYILIRGFSEVILISPIDRTSGMDNNSNMWLCNAYSLKGTRTKFKKEDYKSRDFLKADHLYIMGESSYMPLELLPLIQMKSSPKSERNACYFYNRIEKDKARFVSYHYENEPEIIEDIKPLESTIKIIDEL